MDAAEEFGYKRTEDFNSGNNEGMGYFPFTIKNGFRCSTAVGYLNPIKKRKNLKVVTKAHTKNSSYEPGEAPSHWVRGDVCGKLLNSCKLRYQAQKLHTATTTPVMSTGVGFNFLTSHTLNTEVSLPFGGFPGSRKFR